MPDGYYIRLQEISRTLENLENCGKLPSTDNSIVSGVSSHTVKHMGVHLSTENKHGRQHARFDKNRNTQACSTLNQTFNHTF